MADDPLLLLGLLLVAAAGTGTVLVRDPVRQSFLMSLFGLALAGLFLLLQAPDVALSQLAVGAAVTPIGAYPDGSDHDFTTGSPRARAWAGPGPSRSPPTRTAPSGSAAPPPPTSEAPSRCDRDRCP